MSDIHTASRARRSILQAATGTSLLSLTGTAGAQSLRGRQVLSSGFGGSTMDIIQKAIFDPFQQASGAKTTQVPMQSAAALARMKTEAGRPQIDMYQFSGGQEAIAKSTGLSQPMGEVPLLAKIPEGLKDPDRHWVTWAVIAEGLLYRTDKIRQAPRSYKDLLKPEYRGHVAFPAITNGYGMDLLVMLARAHGGSEKNIDPGFAALAKIRDQVIFKAASDLPTLFGQNDIWIMPYDTGNAYKMQQAGLPVAFAAPEEGSPAVFITACIAKGAANADVASGVINQMLTPASQVQIADTMRWTPSNPETRLPPELASQVPAVDKLAILDRDLINTNRPAWTDRWNRQIAR
jgi:putative spermidine/putrescine transport system substrate-binding protein